MANINASPTGVVIVGHKSKPMHDLYHLWLRTTWPRAILLIAVFYLVINTLFALVFMTVGGVANSRGDFFDSLFFSIETMGTIGYGEMTPATRAAHSVVMLESVTSLLLTALATGLVFSKFSLPLSRLIFSQKIAIFPMNGVPTLALRLGNERTNVIAEARIRLGMVKTEVTQEGVTMYRLQDLTLVRDTSQALTRSWTVMHVIDQTSPLFGMTPESLVEKEVEFFASVVGTDDTTLQPVHARHRYQTEDVAWGARHADVLSELPDGQLQMDLSRFHEMVDTTPTPDFPYPRPQAASVPTPGPALSAQSGSAP
jgi:inward rectifier potassium channel